MTEEADEVSQKAQSGVTLKQMLKVLDVDVATGIERRLKKLSKKKAIEKPLDEHKAAQLERISAYQEATKEVSQWDPVVERNRKAKNLQFPLDIEPEYLPTSAECVDDIKPRNDLEKEVQSIIDESRAARTKQLELTKTEEQYQKAISAVEANERHKELQKMRIKLGSYAAKMRRQKGIKSKSYHKLLKHERIRKHMKRVESNQDALLEEIEKLQRLRAQERASLKHKNTGKWAKHAKFRSKYDEEARKAMLDQIGIASKLLERPAMRDSSSDEDDEDEVDSGENTETEDDDDDENQDKDEDEISEVSSAEDEEDPSEENEKDKVTASSNDRLIVSTELFENKTSSKKTKSDEVLDSEDDSGNDDEDDEQRKLMSEAFENDDVVNQFKEAKDKVADEEQPKDINTFLPGWGDWAGPGITTSKRKSKRFIIKAKRVKRKDETLGNVIISEKANDTIREFQPKSLPRGIRSDNHLKKIVTEPITATFLNQTAHRERVRPKIETRMGKRIEPISQESVRVEWST